MDPPRLRRAEARDIPAIEALIELSVRELQKHDYSAAQLDGALGLVFGVDRQLIADGTYFVAEAAEVLVGCGGWSQRKTLFGSDRRAGREDELLDPAVDAAKIRAFFVHPEWARRGIGSKILAASEKAAMAAGFTRFELGATLTGVGLYRARGYEAVEEVKVELGNGERLPIVRMSKRA